jgi:hypothetical protein
MKKEILIVICLFFWIFSLAQNLNAATVYIDPTCVNNGNGNGESCATATGGAGAKNTWGNIVWVNGNSYLQKRGTTYRPLGFYIIVGAPNVTIGAYGTGNNPIISLRTSRGIHVNTNNYSGVTIQDLKFTGGENQSSGIVVAYPRNIIIQRCIFDEINGHGISLQSATPADTTNGNILIEDCNFSNSPTYTAVYGSMPSPGPDSMAGSQHDITLRHCFFDNIRQALAWNGAEDYIGVNDYAPYGIIFEDNTVINNEESAIGTYCGIKKVAGHTSYIRRNNFTNVGTDTLPSINGFQIQWARDLIIEDNILTNLSTSLCDGAGIILDFAWSGGQGNTGCTLSTSLTCKYLSDNVIVRRNDISGCNACATTSMPGVGIAVAQAINSIIYDNYVHNNEMGLIVHRTYCLGSKIYNNTIVDNVHNGIRVYNASVINVQNNIISGNGNYGIYTNSGGNISKEDHNCFYNNLLSHYYDSTKRVNISLNETDIVNQDPKLTGYNIASDSPCINMGARLSNNEMPNLNKTTIQNLIYEFKSFKAGQNTLLNYIQKLKEFIFG